MSSESALDYSDAALDFPSYAPDYPSYVPDYPSYVPDSELDEDGNLSIILRYLEQVQTPEDTEPTN